jgi:hypothetical protein
MGFSDELWQENGKRCGSIELRRDRLQTVQRESLRQADHLFQTLLQHAFTTQC